MLLFHENGAASKVCWFPDREATRAFQIEVGVNDVFQTRTQLGSADAVLFSIVTAASIPVPQLFRRV
jgi:hypothetical protein